MAYTGILFTLGGEKFPLEWVFKESYHVTPHTYDLDSTRTTTGVLQRNVLDHKSASISFETKPMKFEEYEIMWAWIRSKYIDARERKVSCTYYNFESGQLESISTATGGMAYIPDVEHSPDMVIGTNGLALSSTIEIIGY